MSANLNQAQMLRALWWLHPTAVFACLVLGTLLAATLLADEAYSLYGMQKFLDWSYFGMGLGAVLAFAIGQQFSTRRTLANYRDEGVIEATIWRWFIAASLLTLAGYAAWFGVALRNGLSASIVRELLLNPDSGAAFTLKEEIFTTIPGVTTCTQFGMAAVVLGTWLYFRGQRRAGLLLGLLFLATLLRAFLYSERLALIEAAIPAIIVYLRLRVLGKPFSAQRRFALQLAPLLAVVVLVGLFGVVEYFRSWSFYQREFDSFWEFTLWRLTGYYATALNNGAMLVEFQGTWPLPYMSLHALWTFPLVKNSPFAYEYVAGLDASEAYEQLMLTHGNIELNNDSGLFQPALDFGPLGFVVFWLAYGVLAGRLHRGFLSGERSGLFLYPIVFVSLLEVPRILYLPSARVLPTLVLLVSLTLWLHWQERRTTAARLATTA